MLHDIGLALVITRREVRDQLRDWRIIFPVLALTLFFPFLMNFTAEQILGFVNKYGATISGERLVPFLLMIVGFFPISVSLVIALETFVGEKERGSIEPLLNTPLKDWQLYLGKLLAATVPPLMTSFLGMGVYLVGLAIKDIPIPEPQLLAQIIILTVVQATMMVSGAVVVSSQATSVRAANLLASFIIIPVAMLIQGESVVMFWGNYATLWWAVFGLMVLTALLVRVGLAHFQREELLGKEIDVLNFRWMGRVFWRGFTGGARNVWQWYRVEVAGQMRRLGVPFLLVTALAVAGAIIGYRLIERFQIPLEQLNLQDAETRLSEMAQMWRPFVLEPVGSIWWQNVRVMLLALVAGLFSFGILGMLPLMASVGVAGYLMALLSSNGMPVMTFLWMIIPHGVLEIPAVILATAAVLRMGALMATPDREKPVGEVLLLALADWFKIMVGVVIPVLLIAAAIEVWVTPSLAIWLIQ